MVAIGALFICSVVQSSKFSTIVPITLIVLWAAASPCSGVAEMAILSLTKPHWLQSKLLKNAEMVQRLNGGTYEGNASSVT